MTSSLINILNSITKGDLEVTLTNVEGAKKPTIDVTIDGPNHKSAFLGSPQYVSGVLEALCNVSTQEPEQGPLNATKAQEPTQTLERVYGKSTAQEEPKKGKTPREVVESLTELAKQHVKGVDLNVHIKESNDRLYGILTVGHREIYLTGYSYGAPVMRNPKLIQADLEDAIELEKKAREGTELIEGILEKVQKVQNEAPSNTDSFTKDNYWVRPMTNSTHLHSKIVVDAMSIVSALEDTYPGSVILASAMYQDEADEDGMLTTYLVLPTLGIRIAIARMTKTANDRVTTFIIRSDYLKSILEPQLKLETSNGTIAQYTDPNLIAMDFALSQHFKD